jgi:hypothetical protein
MTIRDLNVDFSEYRTHHDSHNPKKTVSIEVVVDSYEEYTDLFDYIRKFNYRAAPQDLTVTINPSVNPQNIAEVFKTELLQQTDERQVPLFKPENIVTYAPVVQQVAAPEPPPVVVAPPVVVPPKVHVAPEVDSPKLVNDVLFLFEEDCKKIKTMQDALKVWKDHAGAIKKLAEPDKLRGSNTLAFRLAEVLNVEPEEAKELFRAAMSGKKAEAPQEPVAAPAVPVNAPVASPVANAPSEAANSVLEALAGEPKPMLGLAVKHACTHLKTEQGVSAQMVEDLLVSMIGKHPALNVTPEEIYKITRQSTMKLYAGAAKTKLLDK